MSLKLTPKKTKVPKVRFFCMEGVTCPTAQKFVTTYPKRGRTTEHTDEIVHLEIIGGLAS
jgi:hypothetical protein